MIHPAQSYTFADGNTLRLRGNNILVRGNPIPKMSSGGLIHIPGSAVEHVHRTGTVLAFGTRELKDGTLVPLSDELYVGLGVLFVRYLAEQETNKDIKATFGDDIFRLRIADIIVAYDGEPPVIGAS